MKKVFFYFSLFSILLLLSNCGGVQTTKIDEFNLTIDLPSGWKIGKDDYKGKITFEVADGGRRILNIKAADPVVESLDMLVKGSKKSYEVLSQESIPNGFGVVLQTKKKKQFRYYINKDGKQYCFEPNPYYKDEDLEKAIEIIKTAK